MEGVWLLAHFRVISSYELGLHELQGWTDQTECGWTVVHGYWKKYFM